MTDSVRPVGGNGAQSLPGTDEIRKQFQNAIAGTFYRQMMKSLRSTTGKPAYLHGGQAEEIFRGQLDEIMADQLAAGSGQVFSDRLFELQFPHLKTGAAAAPDSTTRDSASPEQSVQPQFPAPAPAPGFSADA